MTDYFFIDRTALPFFISITAFTMIERPTMPFFIRLDVAGDA